MEYNWLDGYNKWYENVTAPSLQEAFLEGFTQAFEAVSGQKRVEVAS